MPRKHIIVSGRVQGVGFRYHANLLANAYGLTGWVRNLDSGDVVMEIQGPQDKIDGFMSRLGQRSMFIRIDHMEEENCNEFYESGFEVRD
jgi:acylphosphatase